MSCRAPQKCAHFRILPYLHLNHQKCLKYSLEKDGLDFLDDSSCCPRILANVPIILGFVYPWKKYLQGGRAQGQLGWAASWPATSWLSRDRDIIFYCSVIYVSERQYSHSLPWRLLGRPASASTVILLFLISCLHGSAYLQDDLT